MLAGLRDRARHGRAVRAVARRDPGTRTVSLVLDEATATIAMYAIAAHAGEREADVREVQQYGQRLPEGSYGRRNLEAIAACETRIAARLRAIERAYRTVAERDIAIGPPEHVSAHRSAEKVAGREIEPR